MVIFRLQLAAAILRVDGLMLITVLWWQIRRPLWAWKLARARAAVLRHWYPMPAAAPFRWLAGSAWLASCRGVTYWHLRGAISRRRARRILKRTRMRNPWAAQVLASIASPLGMGNDGQKAYDMASRTWFGNFVGVVRAFGPYSDVTNPQFAGGAVPDGGITDNSAAINAATSSVPAAGGMVVFPQATLGYGVSAAGTFSANWLASKANVIYLGMGAKIVPVAGAPQGLRMMQLQADDVTVAGLSFDLQSGNQFTGIFTLNCNRPTIEANRFLNSSSGGVHIAGGTFDLAIIGNRFVGPGYGVLTEDVATGSDWVIIGNRCRGGGGVSTRDGITLNCPTTGVAGVVISDNIVNDYTQVSATTGFGIAVSGISDCSITGNKVSNCGRNGVHVDPSPLCHDISIVGNTCSLTGQGGIEVQSELASGNQGQPQDISIVGNTVRGCCTNPAYNLGVGGIVVGKSTAGAASSFAVKGATVSGNTVQGTANGSDGIYVSQEGGGDSETQVIGNICRGNTGNGIQAYNGQEFLLEGNRCKGNTLYGIRLDGSSTGCLLQNNDLNGNTAGALNDVTSGGNIRRGNQGVNPRGDNTPAVPASGVAQTCNFFDTDIYLTAGISTVAVNIDGVAVGTLAASAVDLFRVPANKQITLTYANAPTWKWYAN